MQQEAKYKSKLKQEPSVTIVSLTYDAKKDVEYYDVC